MKWISVRKPVLLALTILNIGLAGMFYLGLQAFAAWASGLKSWAEILFLAALPMSILGLVLTLRQPRLPILATVNGVLAAFIAVVLLTVSMPGSLPR